MGCRVEACTECTQRCLLIHRNKKGSSPTIISFFKVMIGDQFPRVVVLPPKFAPTVSNLIGRETFIEDTSAKRWKVTISNLNGSVAFRQGWNEFALDHGLEVGDFLVFYYIVGLHFVVKIYNKTGCEKLDFPGKRNLKKRGRNDRNSTAKNSSCHMIDKGSISNNGSSMSFVSGSHVEISPCESEMNDMVDIQIITENASNHDDSSVRCEHLPKSNYIEEPFYMMGGDLGDKQGERRHTIFDLFNYEMQNNDSGPKGGKKDYKFCYNDDTSHRSQLQTGLVSPNLVEEEVAGRMVPPDVADVEMMDKSNDPEEMDKLGAISDKDSCNNITQHSVIKSALKPGNDGRNCSDMSNEVIEEFPIAEGRSKTESKSLSDNDPVLVSKLKHASDVEGMSETFEVLGVTEMRNRQLGERLRIVKEEPLEVNPEPQNDKDNEEIHGKEPIIIKEEPCEHARIVGRGDKTKGMLGIEAQDSVSISSPQRIYCSVTTGIQAFLKLPTCLPSSSNKASAKKERRVVLLRDPYNRLWPVLYNESYEFQILMSGWKAFSRANNIQAGDECVFALESESKSIYRVQITRNSAGLAFPQRFPA